MQTTNNSNVYDSNDRTALAHYGFSSASAYTVTMHTDREEREGGRERVTNNTGGKSDFKGRTRIPGFATLVDFPSFRNPS